MNQEGKSEKGSITGSCIDKGGGGGGAKQRSIMVLGYRNEIKTIYTQEFFSQSFVSLVKNRGFSFTKTRP